MSKGDKTVGRCLLAGTDEEGGGSSLFVWSLDQRWGGGGEKVVPLLMTVQAHKVYPSCGAVTCIIGRATDAVVAFVGGKIAIFSLVSRSFKCDKPAQAACTSGANETQCPLMQLLAGTAQA